MLFKIEIDALGRSHKRNQEKQLSFSRRWAPSYMRRKRREKKLQLLVEMGGRCVDCGFDDLTRQEVFDFDHLPGFEKTMHVGALLTRNVSMEILRREMLSCELVCANCHRTRTLGRRDADREIDSHSVLQYE